MIEILLADRYGKKVESPLCRIGEILIDPTSDRNSDEILAYHLNLSALFGDPSDSRQAGLLVKRKDPHSVGPGHVGIDTVFIHDDVIYEKFQAFPYSKR